VGNLNWEVGIRIVRRYVVTALVVLVVTGIFAGCRDDDDSAGTASSTATEAPVHVTFMAGFKPQANLPFVGAYVAKDKGFFAEEGLEVDIQHVTTPGDNYPLLAAGTVQFSTADAAELLSHRASDPPVPIVSIALIGQTGQQGFAVLASSGINSPADWAGKTAGYKGDTVTPDYLAILAANNVDRASITEVRTGFNPAVLSEGQVDIYPVFLSNEPDTLGKLGYPTIVFTAADYGAPTLGLTYAATEDYIAQNPETVSKFVKAAVRGIEYADQHRDEAIQIVLGYAPTEDPAHQRFMLDTELGMAKEGAAALSGIGYQTLEQWQALHDYLVQYDVIKALADVSKAFTTTAVPVGASSSP
jgi:ABC-type nitrate/sulfonate/bicarbonate transport system substrate-binding protein